MKKSCFALFTFLFVQNVLGLDAIEWFNSIGWGKIVSISSTNLLFQFEVNFLGVLQQDMDDKFIEEPKINPKVEIYRNSSEYINNDELLMITPDRETRLMGRHAQIILVPVTFQNQHKGFQIMQIFHWGFSTTNTVLYFALSETPMEVGEEDVEMMWKNGEFRPLEEFHAMVQRENVKKEIHNRFLTRFFKAIEDRYETQEDRLAFFNQLNAMESREAILAYLDELDRQDEPPVPPFFRCAWLWWLALPVVAVWFVFYLQKRRR